MRDIFRRCLATMVALVLLSSMAVPVFAAIPGGEGEEIEEVEDTSINSNPDAELNITQAKENWQRNVKRRTDRYVEMLNTIHLQYLTILYANADEEEETIEALQSEIQIVYDEFFSYANSKGNIIDTKTIKEFKTARDSAVLKYIDSESSEAAESYLTAYPEGTIWDGEKDSLIASLVGIGWTEAEATDLANVMFSMAGDSDAENPTSGISWVMQALLLHATEPSEYIKASVGELTRKAAPTISLDLTVFKRQWHANMMEYLKVNNTVKELPGYSDFQADISISETTGDPKSQTAEMIYFTALDAMRYIDLALLYNVDDFDEEASPKEMVEQIASLVNPENPNRSWEEEKYLRLVEELSITSPEESATPSRYFYDIDLAGKLYALGTKSSKEQGALRQELMQVATGVNWLLDHYRVAEASILRTTGGTIIEGIPEDGNFNYAVKILSDFYGTEISPEEVVDHLDKLRNILTAFEIQGFQDLMDYEPASISSQPFYGALLEFVEPATESDPAHLQSMIGYGQALSATYKPFYTNVYFNSNKTEDSSLPYLTENPDFIRFDNTYGKLRKALMIATTNNAVQNYALTGTLLNNNTNFKLATLRDFIEKPDQDKMLIVHQGYYNKDYVDFTLQGDRAINSESEEINVSNETERNVVNGAFNNWKGDNFGFYDLTHRDALRMASEPEFVDTVRLKTVPDYMAHVLNSEVRTRRVYDQELGQWKSVNYRIETEVYGEHEGEYGDMSGQYDPTSPWLGIDLSLGMMGVVGFGEPPEGYSENATASIGKRVASYLNSPVWMSSSTSSTSVPDSFAWNWMFLRNIHKNDAIRYTTQLDMDSPLFIDIYGNILTESGTIIIPFVNNSTLQSQVNLLNAGFLLNYGNDMLVEADCSKAVDGELDLDNVLVKIGDKVLNMTYADGVLDFADVRNNFLMYTPSEGENSDGTILRLDTYVSGLTGTLPTFFDIANVIVQGPDGGTINMGALNTGDANQLKQLFAINKPVYIYDVNQQYASNVTMGLESYGVNNDIPNGKSKDGSRDYLGQYIATVIFQVARGARIEDINYTKEGLQAVQKFSNHELAQAARFEDMRNSLLQNAQNALLTIPNPAYIEGLEFFVFMMFKILLIVCSIGVTVQVIQNFLAGTLSVKTFLRMTWALVFAFVAITAIPTIFEISYYNANKMFLKNETVRMAGLQAEKRLNGTELGVLQANSVDESTELLLKVRESNISWPRLLSDMLVDFEINSMTELYQKQLQNELNFNNDDFVIKGDSLYMPINNLWDSSEIGLDPTTNKLRQYIKPNSDISHWMPYYAIIDYLVYNVNTFNETVLRSYNYNTFRFSNGQVRSIDLSTRYFMSDAFLILDENFRDPQFKLPSNVDQIAISMSRYDKIGVYQWYGVQSRDNRDIFLSRDPFINSQWYNEFIDVEDPKFVEAVDRLNYSATNFVTQNSDLLGRISDETFIKMLALHMSFEYNNLFNIPGPQELEIYNLSSEDLMRLSIAEYTDVMRGSPYSYPKFLLEYGGMVAVYAGALLELILLVLSFLKPFATLAIFFVFVVSIIIFKVILHNVESSTIKGFAKFAAILCVVNFIYACTMKFGMWLPVILPMAVCIIVQCIVHAFYIGFYLWLTEIMIRNWRDLGNSAFNNVFKMRTLNARVISAKTLTVENTNEGEGNKKSEGWNIYERLRRNNDNKYGAHYDEEDDI